MGALVGLLGLVGPVGAPVYGESKLIRLGQAIRHNKV